MHVRKECIGSFAHKKRLPRNKSGTKKAREWFHSALQFPNIGHSRVLHSLQLVL